MFYSNYSAWPLLQTLEWAVRPDRPAQTRQDPSENVTLHLSAQETVQVRSDFEAGLIVNSHSNHTRPHQRTAGGL